MKKDASYNTLIYRLLLVCICFFVALLVGGGLAMMVGGYFKPGSRSMYLAQLSVQNVVSFIGASIAGAWLISRKPCYFLGMTTGCALRAYIGVVIIYILAFPALNELIYLNENLHLPTSMAGLEQTLKNWEEAGLSTTNTILAPTGWGSLISGILLIGCLTGLAEEMLFRGLLQRTLESYPAMKHWAIWLAAFIFSAVHMQFFGFFPRLLLGAFFGYLLYTTGSIWPAVFAHALNNSIVVVSTWLSHRCPETYTPLETIGVAESGFPVLACISALCLILFMNFGYRYFFTK